MVFLIGPEDLFCVMDAIMKKIFTLHQQNIVLHEIQSPPIICVRKKP